MTKNILLSSKDKELLMHLENCHAISISQANKLFYKNYEYCRRRLKLLEDNKILKSYTNYINKNKVFYIDKKLSAHDLYIFDVYAELVDLGVTITKFIEKPQYLNGLIIPDAYFEFMALDPTDNKMYKYFMFVEVDFTHFTNISKFQLYEKMCRENVMSAECGEEFPLILLLRPSKNDIRYNSRNFQTLYTDLTLRQPSLASLIFA